MGSLAMSLPGLRGLRSVRGMGTVSTDEQIASFGLSTAGAVGTAVAASTGVTAGAAAAIGVSTGVLTAGIGAAIAGITLLVTDLIANSGCGPTCTQTSDYANQAEALMKQNLAAWDSEPHTPANQAQALANYDALWAKLVQLCSDPSMGNAGVRCISDREGTENGGDGMYDWPAWYRNPIANATDIVQDTTSAAGVADSIVTSLSGSGLLLPALLIGAVLLLGGD